MESKNRHIGTIDSTPYYGVFVTLRTNGLLRGCIGEIRALNGDLGKIVAEIAIASASRDERFPPIQLFELTDLKIEISLLHKPEPAKGLDDLNPVQFGLIVQNSSARGVLLPDIPEIRSAQMQVAIAKQKAGLAPNDAVTMSRFKVTKIEES